MFDELDDDRGFTPPASFRATVLRRGRARRRRRVALTVGGASAAAAVTVPGVYAYYEYRRLDDIHHIRVAGVGDDFPLEPAAASTAPPPSAPAPSVTTSATDPVAPPSTEAPPVALSDATTFLVIGVDTRADADLGTRSDTIMLLRVDPATGGLRLLSIPRDLWVATDGSHFNRINSLLADPDDPAPLVDVIERMLTVSIDHVVRVDFDGFRDLVDLAGGIDLRSDVAMRDRHTGLDVPGGECAHLDGDDALALARSRHTEFLLDGAWKEDASSDFGRIERQQFLLATLARALFAELDDPASIHDFVSIAIRSMVVDSGLTRDAMVSAAWTVRGIGIDALQTFTLHGVGRVVSGASVIVADDAQLAQAADFLRSGILVPVPPTSGEPVVPAETATDPADAAPHLTAC